MTKLLLNLFLPGDRADDHAAIGKLAGITGLVCNALLFLAKLIIGLLAGSVSILADAVNNLSDAATSVITLLGFRLAQQPADEDHPYGHARYEYLSGLAVALVILVIGVQLALDSFEKILRPQEPAFTAATLAVLLCAIAVKLWMRGFFRKLGSRIRSTTLLAAAADSRNDVIVSSAILLSCLVSLFFHINIDGYVGLAAAGFILYSGWGIAKETVSPLLGKQADAELIAKISQLILSHEQVLGIHDLLVHDYGPGQCFASVHVELSAEETALACHDIIDHIECDALSQMNIHLVIHYDPVTVNDEEWIRMHNLLPQILRKIDPQLSMHDLRIVRREELPTLVFDLTVPYDKKAAQPQLQQQIEAALHARGLRYATDIRFD